MAQYHVRLRLQVAKCGFTDPDDVIRSKILQTMRDMKLRREAIVKDIHSSSYWSTLRTNKISIVKLRIWSKSLQRIKTELTEFTQREPGN